MKNVEHFSFFGKVFIKVYSVLSMLCFYVVHVIRQNFFGIFLYFFIKLFNRACLPFGLAVCLCFVKGSGVCLSG